MELLLPISLIRVKLNGRVSSSYSSLVADAILAKEKEVVPSSLVTRHVVMVWSFGACMEVDSLVVGSLVVV